MCQILDLYYDLFWLPAQAVGVLSEFYANVSLLILSFTHAQDGELVKMVKQSWAALKT